jgi:hypothetical protein
VTYLRDIAGAIRGEIDVDRLPTGDTDLLFDLYAVLALIRGVDTTRRDVHEAWVAWMLDEGEHHPSMVPFEDLPTEVQEEDEPFVRAIRTVSSRRGATGL